MILAARQQSNFNVAYDRFKHLSNLGLEPDEKRFTLLNVDLQLVKATKNGSLRIQKLARMVGNIDRNEVITISMSLFFHRVLILCHSPTLTPRVVKTFTVNIWLLRPRRSSWPAWKSWLNHQAMSP